MALRLRPLNLKAAPETIKLRSKLCSQCEHYRQIIDVCDKCGCFMLAKKALKNTKCPIGKW